MMTGNLPGGSLVVVAVVVAVPGWLAGQGRVPCVTVQGKKGKGSILLLLNTRCRRLGIH